MFAGFTSFTGFTDAFTSWLGWGSLTMFAGFTNTIANWLGWGVGGVGGFVALYGFITFGISMSSENPAEKQKATLALIGGAILILLGVAMAAVLPGLLVGP